MWKATSVARECHCKVTVTHGWDFSGWKISVCSLFALNREVSDAGGEEDREGERCADVCRMVRTLSGVALLVRKGYVVWDDGV